MLAVRKTSPQPNFLPQLQPLLDRAREGDVSVLPALRAFLDTHAEVWRQAGDMAKHAEQALLSQISPTDLFLRDTVTRKATELRAELEGSNPSPLERLLVERIVVCWMAVYHADVSSKPAPEDDWTLLATQRKEKRLDSAHRRFTHAIKVLADVRRLLSLVRPQREKSRPVPRQLCDEKGTMMPTLAG